MSVVSASFVGSSILDGVTAATNPTYNLIKLYGEGIVDKLRILDYAMTDAEFDALTIADVYTWDEHTLLYAEFTNNAKAGSVDIATPIELWNVVRFKSGSTTPSVIASGLPAATTNLVDYTAIRPNTYYYRIYPITATAVVADIQSNPVEMCYDFYAFLDDTTGTSFTFKLNIGEGQTNLNSAVSTYEGFTQYPAKSQGLLQYESRPFSALLGSVQSNIYVNDTVEMYNALKSFITNGNPKIMKDRKGNIKRVFTEALVSNIDEKPSELPTTINFQVTEIGVI
jgi:hypothetical protein